MCNNTGSVIGLDKSEYQVNSFLITQQNFICTIPTPTYHLEIKITDLEIYVKVFASKSLRALHF